MKHAIKKVVAVAMALALILSMTVVASATGTTVAQMNDLTMVFGDPRYRVTPPESNMRFTQNTAGFTVSYEGGIANYYPDTLAFYVSQGKDYITSMTGSNVTAQPVTIDGNGNYVPTTNWNTGTYILYISTATTNTKTLTINSSHGNVVLTFDVPTFTPSSGSLISAYLPAPGQFTNEGVTVGGWGDAYDSTGNLKNNSGTGVSLGFYGGYIVFDMGVIERDENHVYQGGGVYNSSDTPYGTDFIIFGNAFWGNSEPGLIQVSENGTTWFDIASSLYYDSSSTLKNQSITYTNPDVTGDAGITNAGNNLGDADDVYYTLNGVGGWVTTNGFHDHSYFPLNANYFSSRYNNPELSQVDTLTFASRTLSNSITNTLTMTGLRLASVTTTATEDYQFGFADVHPNITLGGEDSYNPYTPNSDTAWSTISSGTSGGDPIDISWAVNPDGSPAQLDAIRFIRVYTGVAQMAANNMGEVSTEVCGVSVCDGLAEDSIPTPTVYVNSVDRTPTNGGMQPVTSLGTNPVSITLSGCPTGAIVYMNGSTTNTTFTPSPAGTVVQVIVQSGDAAPYIGWLCLKSGW